jgi:hypothetical protein
MKKRPSDERHIRIYASLYDSPAFRTLPRNALKLWIDLRRQNYGSNNGNISCTLAALRQYDWCSSDTLNRALWELLGRGLIRRTREGKPGPFRLCGLYAFTDIPTGRNDKLDIAGGPATKEFARWVPGMSFAPNTRAAKLAANSASKKTLIRELEGYRSAIRNVTAPQVGESTAFTASRIEAANSPQIQPEAAPVVDSSAIAR